MTMHYPVLAILSLFLGAFLSGLVPKGFHTVRRIIVLLASGASLVMIFLLFKPVMLEGNVISYWLGNWAPVKDFAIGIGIEVDSLSLLFAIIIGVVIFLSSIYSINYMNKEEGVEKYYVVFLLLGGSLMGLVLTGDLFNMYVMIEIMTFSAVGLTAFRNKRDISLEAGFKYIVIGSIGSSMILLGTVLVYAQLHTLNLAQIAAQMTAYGKASQHPMVVWFAIALMIGGYAVKAFLVPCHIVAPDAYTAAPSPISMVFSGAVNKAGVYGILRLLFVAFQTMGLPRMQLLIVFWGMITMFIGVTMALVQNDFKRLLAFHSISQIGYVMVGTGLFTELGMTAGLYHAINHTLFKGLLFLCAGAVMYSTRTTDLNKLGGLAKKMPVTTVLFLIGAFSISGLPPFNGFVSKWMVYQATYEAAIKNNNIGYALVTIIALLVSVLTLASFIKVTQSAFFGQLREEHRNVKEVPALMRVPMIILAAFCFIAGVLPGSVNQYLIQPAVSAVFNVGKYIDAMMGSGYAEKITGSKLVPVELNYSIAGYNPVSWLILFGVLLAAAALVILSGGLLKSIGVTSAAKPEISAARAGAELRLQQRYDTFYCGEKSEPSQVGGSDLFWGLKHNLRHYFKFMHNAHNGNTNDYVLQVIATTAIVILYIFAVVLA